MRLKLKTVNLIMRMEPKTKFLIVTTARKYGYTTTDFCKKAILEKIYKLDGKGIDSTHI